MSGLLTGQDLKKQLTGRNLGEELLLPCNMLRSGENVFLDDVTVEELEGTLQVPVSVVDTQGADLVEALLGETTGREHRRRQIYEQTNSSNCGTP